MYTDYPVKLGTEQVGKVRLDRQGLYCRFFCRCDLKGDTIYRLVMIQGEKQVNLGILVPAGGGFGLETRIPAKRISTEAARFCLVPRHDLLQGGNFVPIRPEEPFAYIERLKDAFLTERDGQLGVMLPQTTEKE